jgi:tape measure domain-containing protein
MAKNDERLIFGVGFDIATGIDEVIKQWEGKESKRLQKALDKKPLKVSLEIKKGVLTELKDFISMTKELASAQKELNNVKKQELDIESKQVLLKQRRAKTRTAESKAAVQEATQQDQINKKKADAAYAEERLANAKKNGTTATNAQNAAYKTQGGYLQRLITRMAAYFSIHQALSFLSNIRAVTAEFELQRISLGALIQDAYKANTIFEQIKVQAVKSPYEVKDLVNYTKRLAAYGVQADDLMDTMNRLADISAGLGADMDRIILAYGQIQAAGVLKGTELRQLTELGIPMVELLASYYSTLRNEVVTTSEVFDMISKKEIPFEAVKDVLTDLTDEGGRFFDMQSKQAETLAGQWANMKDTLSLMFDEIGRTEELQDAMHGWIETVKWLALNWQEVWKAIKLVGVTYLGLKAGAMITRLLSFETVNYTATLISANRAQAAYNAMTFKANGLAVVNAKRMQIATWAMKKYALATNVATKAMYKLAASIMTNPVGWVMGLVGGLSALMVGIKMFRKEGVDSMEKFKESLQDATKDAIRNTENLITNFERLVRVATMSVDGSHKQTEALRRLKQQYGDIFTAEQLEIDNLRKIAEGADDAGDSYDSLARSIRSFEQARFEEEVITQYYTKLEEQFKDTFSKLTDEHGQNYASFIGWLQRNAPTWGEDTDILKEIVKKYMEDTGMRVINLAFRDSITFAEEIPDMDTERLLEMLEATAKDSSGHENKYAAQEILMLYRLAEAYANLDVDVQSAINSFRNLDPLMSDAIDSAQNLSVAVDNIEIEPKVDESGNKVKRTAEEIEQAYDDAINTLVSKAREDLILKLGIDFEIGLTEDQKRALNYFDKEVAMLLGNWDDKWRDDMSDMVTFLDDGSRKVQVYGADQIKGFANLPSALDDVAEKYNDLSEAQVQLQKTYDNLLLQPIDEQDVELIETYRKELTKNAAQLQMLYAFLEKYGALDLLKKEKKSNKVDPRIKQLEEELSLVEKVYKKYEEFRKYMNDDEARAMTEAYFEGIDFQWLDMAFSPEELKAQTEEALRLVKTFWGDTKKLQQNIQFKLGDIDYNETKRELEKKMKKLSDDISRSKVAKEFFDRMLGMTGDRELSATLTLSVYGTTGDDLQKLMTKQVEEAFKNVDISSARLGGGKYDYNILAGLVESLPENQRQAAQSIVDNWRNANADILNDVIRSYEDFMSYEERKTRVAEKYAAERKRIMESELPDDEKDKYIKASEKRQGKELADIAIEEFKASDDWAKSFEDLENLATPTIERLMQSLQEFIDTQEDLSPEQLKALTNEYQKLYDGLIARNPFKAISDGVKEYRTAIRGVALAKEQLDTAIALGDEDLIAYAQQVLTDTFDDAQKATTKLQKGLEGVSSEFGEAATNVEFFANALGLSEDSNAAQFLTSMSNAFKGMSIAIGVADVAMKLFDGTVKEFLKNNPIGWILLAVSAIISTVQAIENARINRIDDDIERLEDRLDSLSYAYDRLQNAQEKTFGTEYIQNYQRQLENLEAQQEAYLKQANLERSKGKKADEDKIKEYEKQARDASDAIKDMYGSLSTQFLGSDLTSAARDFASAWIDAYKEFSSTTDAMKAKFQDMIQNMVVESLLAKVMERALEPVFTMIDEMQDGDFYSPSFWQGVMSSMQTATENGVVGAENVMSMLEQMGINLRGLGGEMTGISRDIATASEESILGLAAGINTQNFYISQVPTKLDTIIGLLRGDGAMPQGSAMTLQDVMIAQNQFLSHLPTIAQHTAETVAECKAIVVETRRTADALDRVIKPDGTRTTYKMNVVTSYQG